MVLDTRELDDADKTVDVAIGNGDAAENLLYVMTMKYLYSLETISKWTCLWIMMLKTNRFTKITTGMLGVFFLNDLVQRKSDSHFYLIDNTNALTTLSTWKS